ncbi:hypothetical protein VTI74DRAFT_4930 [Chaetomium olivicolor]
MLERTATSIEPCSSSLQRVLPSARSCLQSRCKLHTGFWHHGAYEIELLDACQALMRLPPAESKAHTMSTMPPKRPETMTASAFLLDFLYPNGTAALLRRPHPIHPLRLEPPARSRHPLSRLFTSAALRRSNRSPNPRAVAEEESASREEAEEDGMEEGETDEDLKLELPGAREFADHTRKYTDPDQLWKLLHSDRAGAYDQIYQLYIKLEPRMKNEFTTEVLLAIAASTRPIEAWRVNELFALYTVDEWTEDLVRAAVKAHLTLHNVPEAMSIFKTAMERRGFGAALDYIASYGFELSAWDLVLEAWELYFRIKGEEEEEEPAVEPSAAAPAEFAVDSQAAQGEAVADSIAVRTADPSTGLPAEEAPEAPLAESSATEFSASGPSYPKLAATADFEAKVKELYKFLENDSDTLDERTALVDSFLRHLIRHSLDHFRPSDIVFMLDRAKDPRIYERYIIINVKQKRNRLASDLFRKYRALPNLRPAYSVLRAIIDVFFPHDARGMELLREDWYRCRGYMNRRAYILFMIFYSGRGDVKTLMQLGKEFAEHYDSNIWNDPKFISNLMHAHAIRGDPHACRKVMEEAVERSGTAPDITQWNILLNAMKKTGDYGATIQLFSQICAQNEPDIYTFTTMMAMAGFRGDLQFTLELFQLAKEQGIQPTMAMMRPLVDAYCQNDRFAEAESLCVSLTKKREIAGDYTRLWNKLIHQNAKRRDLTAVNRLLEFMSAQGIAYNQETYSHLLLALLYTRQSHHAMHLLRVAQREGVFEPTADHYILLMAAFIGSGEPHMALKTNELMGQWKYSLSAKRATKVIDALGRWQELPASQRRGYDGSRILKSIMRTFYRALEREEQGSPDDVHAVVGLYSKVLFILTQMRDFATVQQIISVHNTRYPLRSTSETIPLKLLHGIMLADFYEGKFDRVKETWELILERSIERFQPASTYLKDLTQQQEPTRDEEDPERAEDGKSRKRVMYRERFRLNDPLKTMQRLYLAEQDADGLIRLVARVRELGFDLDSKNWNYYVQGLARLKKWRQAFSICEEVLMPQWTGWYLVRAAAKMKNQVPLELRRIGRNPHRPRPIAHTLLILAKEYMDLEQMMLWSLDASREFKHITQSCPKTVRAVTSMVRSGTDLEADIFGDDFRRQTIKYSEEYEDEHEEEDEGGEREEGEEQSEMDPAEVEERRRQEEEKRRVRQRGSEKRKSKKAKKAGEDKPTGEVWTEGGFLNVSDSAAQKKGDKEDLSEDDILSALKGMDGKKQE